MELYRTSSEHPFNYADLVRRQLVIADEIRFHECAGSLLLAEVEPVLTVGRRARGFERPPEGAHLLEVDRGGLVTWHGPGQWVVFAVERLDRLTGDRKGVRQAVLGLLGLAQTVVRRFGVAAEIREGIEAGLWGREGKLASVGVQVSGGVLLHGLSLNVQRTPASFRGLSRPCGLEQPVEFLSDHSIDGDLMEKVKEALVLASSS